MTDEEIERVYKAGNATSHTQGLRAVFDAGHGWDPAEEARQVARRDRATAEAKRLADEALADKELSKAGGSADRHFNIPRGEVTATAAEQARRDADEKARLAEIERTRNKPLPK